MFTSDKKKFVIFFSSTTCIESNQRPFDWCISNAWCTDFHVIDLSVSFSQFGRKCHATQKAQKERDWSRVRIVPGTNSQGFDTICSWEQIRSRERIVHNSKILANRSSRRCCFRRTNCRGINFWLWLSWNKWRNETRSFWCCSLLAWSSRSPHFANASVAISPSCKRLLNTIINVPSFQSQILLERTELTCHVSNAVKNIETEKEIIKQKCLQLPLLEG